MAQKESKTHAPKVEFYANNRVARILRKLGLRSRAQIAAWVTQRRSNILRLPLEERYGGEAFSR